MNWLRSNITRGSSLQGRAFCLEGQKGNALLYVLLAVGLLAALTFAYVQDSHDSYAAQSSVQIAESLYSQVNMIKAAVAECINEYPGGGEDSTSLINGSANPNNPYPLNPSSALAPYLTPGGCTTSGSATGCISQAATDDVINLSCPGAPAGAAYIFQGTNNQGRFLPPPPGGIVLVSAGGSGWKYANVAGAGNGVYIQTTSSGDAASYQALQRLVNQFTTGQASLSGLVFTAWIQQD